MPDHPTTPSITGYTRGWTQKVMPEPPPSPTRPHTPEQTMPGPLHGYAPPPRVSEYPEAPPEKTPEPEDIPAPAFPLFDPDGHRARYEEEIVGPGGETRRGMRMKVLAKLDQLEREVGSDVYGLEGIKLRLRIHSQRCALLGLPWSGGDPW